MVHLGPISAEDNSVNLRRTRPLTYTHSRRRTYVIAGASAIVLAFVATAVFSVASRGRALAETAQGLHNTNESLRTAIMARAETGLAVYASNVDRQFGTDSSAFIKEMLDDVEARLGDVERARTALTLKGERAQRVDALIQQFIRASRDVVRQIDINNPLAARNLTESDLEPSFAAVTTELTDVRNQLSRDLVERNQLLGRFSNLAAFVISFLVPTAAVFVYRALTNLPRRSAELEVDHAHLVTATDRSKTATAVGLQRIGREFDALAREHPLLADTIGRLRSQVGELEMLVRVNATGHSYQFDNVPVGEVVDDIATNIPTAGRELVVRADRAALRQALRVLIDNARKHGGASIAVDAQINGTRAHISVVDNGRGLPPDVARAVFERASITDRHAVARGDLGYGLLLAQLLAEGCGGELVYVRVDSLTRMTLVMPLAMSPGAARRAARAARPVA